MLFKDLENFVKKTLFISNKDEVKEEQKEEISSEKKKEEIEKKIKIVDDEADFNFYLDRIIQTTKKIIEDFSYVDDVIFDNVEDFKEKFYKKEDLLELQITVKGLNEEFTFSFQIKNFITKPTLIFYFNKNIINSEDISDLINKYVKIGATNTSIATKNPFDDEYPIIVCSDKKTNKIINIEYFNLDKEKINDEKLKSQYCVGLEAIHVVWFAVIMVATIMQVEFIKKKKKSSMQ